MFGLASAAFLRATAKCSMFWASSFRCDFVARSIELDDHAELSAAIRQIGALSEADAVCASFRPGMLAPASCAQRESSPFLALSELEGHAARECRWGHLRTASGLHGNKEAVTGLTVIQGAAGLGAIIAVC